MGQLPAKSTPSPSANNPGMTQPPSHPVFDKPVSSPDFVDGTPDWVKTYIQKASDQYKIPTMMLSALLKQESGFNPNAKSPVNALGIAQFMPETARGMGVNPLDPESAIMGAARYLRQGWDRFGKPELALASYNAGGNSIQKYGGIPPYKETQNYVKSIMSMMSSPHQSANGPYLDMLSSLKQNSALPAINQQSSKPLTTASQQNQPFPQQPQDNQSSNATPPAWIDLAPNHTRPQMNMTEPYIRPAGGGSDQP